VPWILAYHVNIRRRKLVVNSNDVGFTAEDFEFAYNNAGELATV
jgi:hypothetical protein